MLNGPYKYHENALCVPEAEIEAANRRIESLTAENSRVVHHNADLADTLKTALAEVSHLENAMREIQATTSDKAVLDITDKALCDEPIMSESPLNERDNERDYTHYSLDEGL